MGRTNKTLTPFVDAVLGYYAAGHSVTQTAEQFGVTKNQVNHWAKVRKVSNGRSFREGGLECNRLRSLGVLPVPASNYKKTAACERLKVNLLDQGFDLISEYRGTHTKVTIKCNKCGETFERTAHQLVHAGAHCPNCKHIKVLKEQAKKRTEIEQRKVERKNKNPLGLSYYQLGREKELDILHTCKICGKEYTIRSYIESTNIKYKRDSGFCSEFCRNKERLNRDKENRKKLRAQGKRYYCNHYRRAKKLGQAAEEGITKAKLLKRDGDRCALCTLPLQMDGDPRSDLYWSIDHILPISKGGSHTWENVQLVHRICNSNKRDLIGKEWNNGD